MKEKDQNSINIDNLDHKKHKYESHHQMASSIKYLCNKYEQKHYLERKIKFLLDIRGYLKVNNICGNYVEFGSYKSEMQFAAYNIFKKSGVIENYIGLDTFHGEPELTEYDKIHFPDLKENEFESSWEEVNEFVTNNIGAKGILIRGDFRNDEIIKKLDCYDVFNVVVVDCNLLSSIQSALEYILPKMREGGVIFMDDYYINCSNGTLETNNVLLDSLKKAGKIATKHSFYPPFANSYIISTKKDHKKHVRH